MSFNLESNKNSEINETPDIEVDSEQLSETEDTAENYDDCSLNEVQDDNGNEVNAESLAEAEENYDDCEAKVDEMEAENPELAEDDYDDFNDCGKETDGEYVAEVTYTTDGEVSDAEATAELQEAYNECDDPEDMQQLKENANENEHIEVHTAEVVERPENGEVTEELTEEEYEEAQEELEEAEENLEAQQEAAEEYQNDLENQINNHENEVPEGTENIDNETSEETETTDDEVSENTEDPEVSETEETSDGSDEVEETDESDEDAEVEEDSENSDEDGEEVKEDEDVESSETQETTEAESEQVEEQTEETDESSETSEDNLEETDGDNGPGEVEELDEDAAEIEEVDTDDLEQMDAGSKVESSKINEKEVSEDVSQKVEDETDEELSDESKEQIADEVGEEIDGEADDNTISSEEAEEIINEKVEEKVDAVEEQNDTIDEEIESRADEIVEDEDLTADEAKEQISKEVAETTTDELTEGDVEAMVEEKSKDIDDAIEDKNEEQVAVEAVEETAEDLEDEQTEQIDEKTEKSLQERIDCAFEKEEVSSSEINDLRDENAAELQAKIEEKSATEAELKNKFDEVLSKEKGGDEYKQSLQEYNALQDQKASLDEQIASMEKQQDLLDKKSLELREAQIQKGAEAVAASSATLAGVNALQERYDQTYYDAKSDTTELASIRDDSYSTIKELSAEKDAIKQAMDAKMDEISEYVTSNNMDRYDTAHDFRYQQLSAEYAAMKESYDRIGYSIVKLDENNKTISDRLGDKYFSVPEVLSDDHIRIKEYTSMINDLNKSKVKNRPITEFATKRTDEEIIARIGGGDKTRGSCSSLAFAYAGNKAGYDVLDFRDGESRTCFSSNDSIKIIADLPEMDSKTVYGTDDVLCANELMKGMGEGKEYYLATGLHASIVRKTAGGFEYLELQSATDNGWKPLDNNVLVSRFGCSSYNNCKYPNFIIDVESLGKNKYFLNALGYINTAENKQRKGVSGHVR